MQNTSLDESNISPTELKAEILQLRATCKALITKNEELVTKNEEYAGIILALREQVQLLKDEIAILKGQKPRPKIPPNRLDKNTPDSSDKSNDGKGKHPGSNKRSKTANLEIDETRHINLKNVPPDATFNGWSDYTVQDLTVNRVQLNGCN